MPSSCQIGIIYCGDETGEQWKNYWTSLLDRGNNNVSVRSLCTQSTELSENITKSTLVIVLLTESMLSFLERNEGLKFCSLLRTKSVLAGILCYTEQSKFDEISSERITNVQSWNVFHASDNSALNKQVACKIMDLVDSISERRVTKIRKHATVMPSEIRKPDETVAIIFKKEVKGKVEVSFGKTDKRIQTEQINIYTYKATIPMKESGLHKLHIYIDDDFFCQYPLRFVPPGLDAFQCPQFLCQILGVAYTNDLEALDAELVRLYDESAPKDDSLNTLLGCYTRDTPTQRSPHELPTLLHFAASNGLSLFCSMLLDAPGSLAAYQVENKDGKDPAELAESAGHTELANYLRTFIETEAVVKECDDIYIEMKGRSIYENLSLAHPTEEDDVPDLQTFKKQPKDMRTRRHSEPSPSKPKPPTPQKMPSAEEFMFGEPRGLSKTATLSGSRSQDELIELAQAVKDKEFTINEAERLYESWIARNHNSSCSIKERQQSLEALRQEYGRVIEVVKNKRGETGVFKKLKKKLVKKVSNLDLKISKPITNRPPMTLPSPSEANRLSSSSSSSRESCDSQGAGLIYGYGSESDDLLDEEDDSSDNQKVDIRPKSSPAFSAKKKRQSFREQYMKTFDESKSEDPPEVPPRKSIAPPVPPRNYSKS